MKDQPIRDERILEAIEACRPGSDDMADGELAFLAAELEAHPELADLYDRLQRTDEVVAAAFREVPVPEGLEQRLLDHLAAARAADTLAADSRKATAALAEDRPVVAAVRPRRFSRRWLIAGGTLTTTAAAVLVAVVVWMLNHGPQPYTKQMVLEDAQRFFIDESRELGPIRTYPNEPPPADYRIRPEQLGQMLQWRPITGFLDCDGVAYDVPGGQATIYVVRRTIDDRLPVQPPPSADPTTGGVSASVWQQGELLCVLVVDGDSDAYRRFYHDFLLRFHGTVT
ncbi:MAG TPA: hypothetical protein VMY42_25560 [Thermoguttaceae bacterium]|nr:hypothetical protein [Thermoguttaceae bacterium]